MEDMAGFLTLILERYGRFLNSDNENGEDMAGFLTLIIEMEDMAGFLTLILKWKIWQVS